MRELFERSKPIKDARGYALWNLRQRHCAACGIPKAVADSRYGFALTTHHIVKSGRSDEPGNLLRLCWRCHQCAENQPQLTAGIVYPILTLANCLWLKRLRNPGEFDIARVRVLLHRNPPDPEEPDAAFAAEYEKWQKTS